MNYFILLLFCIIFLFSNTYLIISLSLILDRHREGAIEEATTIAEATMVTAVVMMETEVAAVTRIIIAGVRSISI